MTMWGFIWFVLGMIVVAAGEFYEIYAHARDKDRERERQSSMDED